jgi:hypothetical protein
MKFVRSIVIAAVLTSGVSRADEILDNNVTQDQVDIEQNAHWTWCGKECRTEAKKKAKKVLRRLDDLAKNYATHEAFYADTSDMFKRKATMEQWMAAFQHRNKLGNARRRIHESVQGTFKNLPNVDNNKKYVIVTFDTMFEGEKGIFTEQVTLIRKKDNRYKFVGYYFSKKPYYDFDS